MNDNSESFVARWSRRKTNRPEDRQAPISVQAEPAERDFADVDFGALDINSDFTRFMRDNVPDSIRNRALQMLWASSDVIGKPDDLDDFLEDFSEETMALPPELARSAYKIGAGFVAEESAPAAGDNGGATPNQPTSSLTEQKMNPGGPEGPKATDDPPREA